MFFSATWYWICNRCMIVNAFHWLFKKRIKSVVQGKLIPLMSLCPVVNYCTVYPQPCQIIVDMSISSVFTLNNSRPIIPPPHPPHSPQTPAPLPNWSALKQSILRNYILHIQSLSLLILCSWTYVWSKRSIVSMNDSHNVNNI